MPDKVLFPAGYTDCGVRMNTRLYPVPTLRMSGAKPPLYSRTSCLAQGLRWCSQTVRMIRKWKRRGDRENDVICQLAWPKLTHYFYSPYNCGALQSLSCDQRGPSRSTHLKIYLSTLSQPNTVAYLSCTCKALYLCCMPHHFLHS